MKKVHVEAMDGQICDMFVKEGWIVTHDILEADLLCLEGGADVTPELYGEINTFSQCSLNKDVYSFGLLAIAVQRDIPVVGICRGSQVLNVYNGGKMKQHIEGHGVFSHKLTVDGETYDVSSTHHQESVPCEVISEDHIWRADDGTVEMIYYEEERMLGCQFHPEYSQDNRNDRKLFFKMLERIM